MDEVTVLRDRLLVTDGVVILHDSSPNGIHFTMDHAISGRSTMFDLVLANDWWVLSRMNAGKIKEYKVANYKPSW